MEQGPGEDGLGEVDAPAAVEGDGGVEPEDASVGGEPRAVAGEHPVPLARHRHVLCPGQAHAHRAAGEPGPEGRHRGEAVRLHLLAAEPAPHPQALHGDRVAGHAEDVGDDLLGLGRVLGAAVHEHLAALVDERDRRMGLEVEVLLSRDVELALDDERRAVEGRLDVPRSRWAVSPW